MAAELPPSRFKTTGSLASLRRLMGWQAPDLTCKVKSGAASLTNMRPGDFVFFVAYALVGLVPPLSSFLALLEYYGSSCSIYLPTPSFWWPSSSTSTRCMWGYDHRCGCSGASSC
jgi:hypothetical protein